MLALVFAGACSDGSDEAASDTSVDSGDGSGGDNNEGAVSDSLADKIKGTEWKFTGVPEGAGSNSDEKTLGTVTLEFGSDGSTVTSTATWWVRNSSDNVAHAGTFTATSYKVEGDTVTVTLGTVDAVKLPLTLDDTSYSTDAGSGIVTIKLSTDSTLAVGEL